MSKSICPVMVDQIEDDAATAQFNELFTAIGRLRFMATIVIPCWAKCTDFVGGITPEESLREILREISVLLDDARKEVSILENDLLNNREAN